VYDAGLDKKFGPMVMQNEKWEDTIEGVGYSININENGDIHTEKKVYRSLSAANQNAPGISCNPFPVPDGPFSVGVKSFFWIDNSRDEIFTRDPDDRRHLLVQVWYPAQVTPGMEKADYIQNPEAYGNSANSSPILNLKTNSVLNASLSDASVRYPVILFSHGKNATRFCCTYLMEHLASHGYIIFSIGHTFFNGVEVFPGWIPCSAGLFSENTGFPISG
jgi:hypothetical protein